MNNDFFVTREAIGQWFSWKSLPNCLTRDKKIVIHGNSCIILYVLSSVQQQALTKFPDFSQISIFPDMISKFPDFSLTFAWSGVSPIFPCLLDTLGDNLSVLYLIWPDDTKYQGICRKGEYLI